MKAVSSIALGIYLFLAFARFYPICGSGSGSAVRLCEVAFAQRAPLFSATEGKREEEEEAALL